MADLPPHLKAAQAMFHDRMDALTKRMAELQKEASEFELEAALGEELSPSEREAYLGRPFPDVFSAEDYLKLLRDRVAHDAYMDARKRRLS
jgi:hypothetical protein